MTDNIPVIEEPIFNLDELSWGDTKALAAIGSRIRASVSDESAVMAAFSEAEVIIGSIVECIPRSWLVKRAPATIDYTAAGGFNWLRRDKFLELLTTVLDKVNGVEEDSKNSEAGSN